MIELIGGFALGVVSGMVLLHVYIISPLRVSKERWMELSLDTSLTNLKLLSKLYEKPIIKTQEKPVFRSESEKGKKSAKVSRSNAGRVR